jgi:hypothetical protein
LTTTEALVAARALLVSSGWIRGTFKRNEGYCLTGAISYSVVGLDREPFWAATRAIRAFLPGHDAEDARGIHSWNDRGSRTKEEVLAVIDQAIASLVAPV